MRSLPSRPGGDPGFQGQASHEDQHSPEKLAAQLPDGETGESSVRGERDRKVRLHLDLIVPRATQPTATAFLEAGGHSNEIQHD